MKKLTRGARQHLLVCVARLVAAAQPPPNGVLSGEGWSGDFGGMCPVQGEGMVDGLPFYFRARGDEWSLEVATNGGDPVGVSLGDTEGFYHAEDYGTWPDAGYMPQPHVQACMARAVEAFRRSRAC